MSKRVQNHKIQAEINCTCEQNVKRKMDKVQNREWDSRKGSEACEHHGPPPKKTDNYNRPQSASNQPTSKQSNNSTKPTSSKPALSSNEPSINETSADVPSVNSDEHSSNEPIPAPEIPELPVSATVFSPDQENYYSAWFTPGDTTVPKEAFVDPFLSADQEKLDYSEWFSGDTLSATQNYSDWSIPDQSAGQTGQTGSHQPSNS